MDPKNVLIVTTTKYPKSRGPSVRYGLAVAMLRAARQQGHPVIVVDDSGSLNTFDAFEEEGAMVYPQHHEGRGASFRELFFHAQEYVTENRGIQAVLYTEPEKDFVIPHVGKITEKVNRNEGIVVTARRSDASWPSWPDFQVVSEQGANRIYADATGWEGLDPMFGTVAFHPSVLPQLITFDARIEGNMVPDTYVQILAPIKICAEALRCPIAVEVDVEYPPEQRDEEVGALRESMLQKRREQFRTLTEGFRQMAFRYSLRGSSVSSIFQKPVVRA